jgi:hypothetical protein
MTLIGNVIRSSSETLIERLYEMITNGIAITFIISENATFVEVSICGIAIAKRNRGVRKALISKTSYGKADDKRVRRASECSRRHRESISRHVLGTV